MNCIRDFLQYKLKPPNVLEIPLQYVLTEKQTPYQLPPPNKAMAPRTGLFFILFSLVSLLSLPLPLIAAKNYSSITAIYSFGDSLVDPGNNNHLPTIVRADHAPYGINFPDHLPTGRFSDGKLVTDFMAASLGLKEVLPAYLDPSVTDGDLLTGVSFASAGSGLDNLIPSVVNALKMSDQVEYFGDAVKRMNRAVGEEKGRKIVSNALFVIVAGSNDMLYNYYDLPTRKLEYSLSDYHHLLLTNLESVVQRLYKLGARKFLVAGLPPIGCLPMQLTLDSIIPSLHLLQRVCVNQQNNDSQDYNKKLQALVTKLKATRRGTRVAYLDIYNPTMDMIKNPDKYGFEQTLVGCCGTGLVEMAALCNELTPTCPDPSKYMFWDAVHPTQVVCSIVAKLFEQSILPVLVA